MNRKTRSFLLGLIAATALACAGLHPDTPPQAPRGRRRRRARRVWGGGAQNAEPQAYDRVITKDAKTTKGLFTVHQIQERYFFEIPKSELGKEFLWNTQIAKTALGVGYGGGQLVNKVVKWESERESRSASRGELRGFGRSQFADRGGGEGCE